MNYECIWSIADCSSWKWDLMKNDRVSDIDNIVKNQDHRTKWKMKIIENKKNLKKKKSDEKKQERK